MSHSLASFPEELLARILALCVTPPPVLQSRPAWDVIPSTAPRSRLAPLLVCRQFLRIASPLFYHTLHIQSATQATRVLDTLRHHPSLADAVRRIVFCGIWSDCAGVLTLCRHVEDIDICLDSGPTPGPLNDVYGNTSDASDVDAKAFCFALEQRNTIVHLTIRKDPAAYLTHPRPQYVLERLARAIHNWTKLETVHFGLRISSSPVTLSLAHALSMAPRLRSIRAQLPSVWNDLLLVISTNPSLEKVMLYSESMFGTTQSRWNLGPAVIKGGHGIPDDIENAVLGTGLYMMQARKHARLSELIKAGTSIIRTRAHTTISTVSNQPGGGATLLGPIRAKEVAVELLANRNSLGAVPAQSVPPIGRAREV